MRVVMFVVGSLLLLAAVLFMTQNEPTTTLYAIGSCLLVLSYGITWIALVKDRE